MGNDGGSIPTRRELVKEAARNPTTQQLKESLHEQQSYAWTTCPLSKKPLAPPIVSDCTGRLYNKDSVIELLLGGSTGAPEEKNTTEPDPTRGAIKALRDVVEVRFTPNSADGSPASASASDNEKDQASSAASRFKCPITQTTLGPGAAHRAVYLVPCGHAFSAAAVREVSGEQCLVCEAGYAADDVIPILPVAQGEVARLAVRSKGLAERGLAHSLKKVGRDKGKKKGDKKRKKGDVEEEEEKKVPELVRGGAVRTEKEDEAVAAAEKKNGSVASSIRNSGTASLTARVMAEQEQTKKRRLENENLKSLFSSRDQSKPIGRSSDFMTRGFDISAKR